MFGNLTELISVLLFEISCRAMVTNALLSKCLSTVVVVVNIADLA